ncbi:hypothetical protein [Leptospira idonii]|uniref:SH3b domain-containing protein n=1 Tax=Leptospira idonii TaxID=1193500 RepID=A0A4V3JXX6_9LEPT|nr:hypothetical protein [Leptospira idonii]TGN18216.1 hypothetical protein EHS15_12450 [Leptospira idonii]
MIRSRVFFAIGIIFLSVSLLVYLLVDFRDKEDKAYSYFTEQRYEKVLELYRGQSFVDSEVVLSLLSQSVSHLEKKANDRKTGEETLRFLETFPEIQKEIWNTERGDYVHLKDPYLPLLRKHGLAYKQSIVTKLSSFSKPIPKNKAAYFLLLLIVEDPRGMEDSFSSALANILKYPLDTFGEIEGNFLLETLHYLSSSANSSFYDHLFSIQGTNVNLRSGPGKENKEVGKISSPEQTFCFEKDNAEETLAGRSGHWTWCYFPVIGRSAWIFSGFLQKSEPDSKLLETFSSRWKSSESETKIDFEAWTGESIPPTFFGKYISRERVVRSGVPGFPIPSSSDNRYERICKKLTGEINYFDFSFERSNSKKTPTPLMEIYLDYAGSAHLAYRIDTDLESILVNRNRYILEADRGKENFTLKIGSKQGDKLTGSLWKRNANLLSSLSSESLDPQTLQSGKYSWQICLPLALSPNRERALLFEIRTGTH